MKHLLIVLSILLIGGCTGQKKEDPKTKTEVVNVALPTMVCQMCANTITAAVYRVDGVKNVDVDVDKKTAHITFVSYQTNLPTIERAISEAGYDADTVKRNPDGYANLAPCCKKD